MVQPHLFASVQSLVSLNTTRKTNNCLAQESQSLPSAQAPWPYAGFQSHSYFFPCSSTSLESFLQISSLSLHLKIGNICWNAHIKAGLSCGKGYSRRVPRVSNLTLKIEGWSQSCWVSGLSHTQPFPEPLTRIKTWQVAEAERAKILRKIQQSHIYWEHVEHNLNMRVKKKTEKKKQKRPHPNNEKPQTNPSKTK